MFYRKKVLALRTRMYSCACLCAAFAAAGCLELKNPDIKSPPLLEEGPEAIFRADFPFDISAKTPNADSVIPPTRHGCNILTLKSGEQDFKTRYKLIKKASDSVAIQTYIFSNDPAGRKVAKLLRKKSRKGMNVRLIIDAYTKFSPSDRLLYFDLERAGVNVAGFEPIYFMGVTEKSYFKIEEVNRRFHEKYLIVDDCVAMIGGRNIADEYASWDGEPENMWRDQDVVLTGPVVQDIRNAFEENFGFLIDREDTRPFLINPPWWKNAWNILTGRVVEEAESRGLRKTPDELDFLEFTAFEVPVRFLRSRPRFDETYIYQAYMYLISAARDSVLIENAYFVPDKALIEALCAAAQRGVKVTIITNSEATNDVFQMQPLTRYSYLPLIKAGAEIYEWQGIVSGHGSLHSKFAVIDGRISIVGSFNLDPRSKFLNSEDAVVIHSEAVALDLTSYVMQVDMAQSERVGIEKAKEWRNPSDLENRFKLIFSLALEDWW